MGSALQAVLNLKAQEAQREEHRSAELSQAVQLFQQAQQRQAQNQLAKLQLNADLAEKGIKVNPDGSFARDNSLLSPTDLILQKAKLADAQKSIVEAGGPNLNLFGGSGIPADSPVGRVLSRPKAAQSELIPDKFNSMGVATSYMNPEAEQAKNQLDIQKDIQKDQGTRATKLTELNKVIDFFDKKINELPVGTGPLGKLQGTMQGMAGATGLDPKAAAYVANVKGLRSQVARALGEVGNLSETEQKAAIELLPNLGDDAETRKAKLANIREYISTKLQSMNDDSHGTQTFTINGRTYNIPADKVEAFKKAKGLK